MAAALVAGASTGLMQPDSSATRPRRVPCAAETLPVRSPGGASLRRGVSRSMAAIRFMPSACSTGANGLAISPATTASRNSAGSVSTRASRPRMARSSSGRL